MLAAADDGGARCPPPASACHKPFGKEEQKWQVNGFLTSCNNGENDSSSIAGWLQSSAFVASLYQHHHQNHHHRRRHYGEDYDYDSDNDDHDDHDDYNTK